MKIHSKLPSTKTSIFSIMSALAKKHNAINLSQGFPNFNGSQKMMDDVNDYIQQGFNQYAPMAGVPELRNALADKVKDLYGMEISADEEITITAGATQAIFTAISAFVHPGDEVVIIEPAYDCYAPSIEINGGIVKPYSISAPHYKVDWTQFEALISLKTKMIMVNTPHNPTGSILDENDLKNLARLTKDTDIIVISDEVYEHLIYDGVEHQSALKYPDLYQRTILTYSFGKTYHHTGWKMGYAIGPPHLMSEFRKVHQFNVFSVNTPIQYALANQVIDPQSYLSLSSFYQAKRDFLIDKLKESRFRVIPCRGTYFMLLDYTQISDKPDTEFANWLTEIHGVATIPISVFYSDGRDDKVVRICFAKTEDVLADAAAKLCLI